MNQVEDRLSVLDDKVEDQIKQTKNMKKNKKALKATFRKFGTPQKDQIFKLQAQKGNSPRLMTQIRSSTKSQKKMFLN